MVQMHPQNTSQKQSLLRIYEDIPSKLLIRIAKQPKNTLQSKVQNQLASTSNLDTVHTSRQVPSECYQ